MYHIFFPFRENRKEGVERQKNGQFEKLHSGNIEWTVALVL